MGWASAGEIFNPVAQALIDCGADDATKRRVLGMLIDKLQDGDWDTEAESLDLFGDDPLIASLFMERGVCDSIDAPNGYCQIRYSSDTWWLTCCRDYSDNCPGTYEGHDNLVRTWVVHAAERHGGDGKVPDWALILRTEA